MSEKSFGETMPFSEVKPVVDLSVRALCARPYPNHPKGCPNWNTRPTCPPKARLLGDVLDLARPVFAVWSVFDLGAHRARMAEKHPEWTPRQLDCCLYWQGTARARLRREVSLFLEENKGTAELLVLYCPEACGVNITETMKRLGQHLEWPPKDRTFQVAIAGERRVGHDL